jgi:tRNA(Leu) C34 or U34 (ribose-2'-O)-methylase TrmL
VCRCYCPPTRVADILTCEKAPARLREGNAAPRPLRRRSPAALVPMLLALATPDDSVRDAANIHGEGRDAFPLPLQHRTLGAGTVWIRYCYEGGKLTRDGRLERLELPPAAEDPSVLPASVVLDHLQRSGVDFSRYVAHAYDPQLEAWAPLKDDMSLKLDGDGPRRCDVQMLRVRDRAGQTQVPFRSSHTFSIGIVGCKAQTNLGILWRGAYQMGADEVFVVGGRFLSKKKRNDKMLRVKQNRGHVMAGDESVPLREFADWNEFAAQMPQVPLVAVEMGGEALQDFEHPRHAIYVLGSEDNGIPESVLRACDYHVALPSVGALWSPINCPCLNRLWARPRRPRHSRRPRSRPRPRPRRTAPHACRARAHTHTHTHTQGALCP